MEVPCFEISQISNEIEYNPNSWAEEIDGSGLDRPTSAKTVKRPCPARYDWLPFYPCNAYLELGRHDSLTTKHVRDEGRARQCADMPWNPRSNRVDSTPNSRSPL